MYNSQYYTCEQIDQRLLQGYLDDYNSQNNANLTKAEFLTLLHSHLTEGLTTGDILQVAGNNINKTLSQKFISDMFSYLDKKVVDSIGIVDSENSFDISGAQDVQTFDFPVDIKSGETVTLKATGTAEITTFRVYGNTAGTGSIWTGLTRIGQTVEFTTDTDITKLVIYGKGTTVAGTVKVSVVYYGEHNIHNLEVVIENREKNLPIENGDELITSGAVYAGINQEKERAKEEFNTLLLEDTTPNGEKQTSLSLSLNKNEGTPQSPVIRTLDTIVLQQVSAQKAGLMPSKDTWDNIPTPNSDKIISSGNIDKSLVKNIIGVKTSENSFDISGAQDVQTFDFPVDIKSGETVILKSEGTAEITTFRVYGNQNGGIWTGLASIGGSVEFTPDTDITKLVIYGKGTTVAGTVKVAVVYPGDLTLYSLNNRIALLNTGINGIITILNNTKDDAILGSNDLISSGGVDRAIFKVVGVKSKDYEVDVDPGVQLFDFPVDIKSGETVTLKSEGTATVNTFRVYPNQNGGVSVMFHVGDTITLTAEFDINKFVIYSGNTTVAGTVTFKVIYPGDLTLYEAFKRINEIDNHLVNIDAKVVNLNNLLFNNTYTPKVYPGISFGDSGAEVQVEDAFATDYIQLPAIVLNDYIMWSWVESLPTAGKYKLVLYDNNKTYLGSYSSLANQTNRNCRITDNLVTAKYIRASFKLDLSHISDAKVGILGAGDDSIFKLVNINERLDQLNNTLNSLMSNGLVLKGNYDYTDHVGTYNIKLCDISVPVGQHLIINIKTSKRFTRFMVGFNGLYTQYMDLYYNFYNSDTITIDMVTNVDISSIWFFLVSAEDTNMVVNYEIYTGLYADLMSNDEFDKDLAVLPSVTYILSNVENSIYHLNYLKYLNDDFIVSEGGTGWQYLQRKFTTNRSNNVALIINLLKRRDLSVIGRYTTSTVVGDKSISTPAKVVNVIGDSFTYNGSWYQHIADIVEGLTFVGMRRSYMCNDALRGEGRGGWTLAEYFTTHGDITPTHMQPFSPFMHVSGYTYYGVIEFWKAIVTGTSQYTYGTNGFGDYSSWFDNNGLKINPSVNDLMYDGTNDIYLKWNGSAWVDSGITDSDFEFNYSKYISTWNITSPDIVIVMLGKNDFYSNGSEAIFNPWKAKMDTLITSVQAYATSVSKHIDIGICTPTTANEAPNNSDHAVPEIGGRNMWNARKQMIEYYDTQAFRDQGVYLVDCGICLDPIYGFPLTTMKPFEFYEGDDVELVSTNGVHPSTAGYKQLGTCIAGFIQTLRAS